MVLLWIKFIPHQVGHLTTDSFIVFFVCDLIPSANNEDGWDLRPGNVDGWRFWRSVDFHIPCFSIVEFLEIFAVILLPHMDQVFGACPSSDAQVDLKSVGVRQRNIDAGALVDIVSRNLLLQSADIRHVADPPILILDEVHEISFFVLLHTVVVEF